MSSTQTLSGAGRVRSLGSASVVSVLIALCALFIVVDAVRSLTGSSMVVRGIPITVAPDAAGIGTASPSAVGDVTISGLPTGTRLMLLTTPVLSALIVLAGIFLVMRVLGEISQGRPFTAANVTRLRVLGLLLLAWAAVLPALSMLLTMLALSDRSDTTSFVTDVPMLPLLSCITAFAVAQAFERGRRLEDDVEGLV